MIQAVKKVKSMNRPNNLNTRLFLDGGIPDETREVIKLLGFLDGQTTNPTLITKHPSFLACQAKGEKCTENDGWKYYKEIVSEISPLVKNGSVSIEVYADHNTKAEEMVSKGQELFQWIPNAHVKLPITPEGLKAAEMLVRKGIRVKYDTLFFAGTSSLRIFCYERGKKRRCICLSVCGPFG